MKTVEQLAIAIKQHGDALPFDEALCEYTCMSEPVCKWIVSHEAMRRERDSANRRCQALQAEVNELRTELQKIELEQREMETVQS